MQSAPRSAAPPLAAADWPPHCLPLSACPPHRHLTVSIPPLPLPTCLPSPTPCSDPSQASLTCVAVRPVTVADEASIAGAEGREIFTERKGLNLLQNKNLRVRRIFDQKNRVLIYTAYSTRFTGASDEKDVSTSRYRTSVCAVPLAPAAPALVPVSAE